MRIKWIFIALGLIVLAVAWRLNPPGGITTGSPTDIAVFLFLFGSGIFAGVLSLSSAVKITRNQDGTFFTQSEHSRWKKPGFLEDEQSSVIKKEKQMERISDYRKRAHAAVFGSRKVNR